MSRNSATLQAQFILRMISSKWFVSASPSWVWVLLRYFTLTNINLINYKISTSFCWVYEMIPLFQNRHSQSWLIDQMCILQNKIGFRCVLKRCCYVMITNYNGISEMISLEKNELNELQRISTGRRVRKYLLNARQLSKQHQNWLIFITMPLCSPASKIILIRLYFISNISCRIITIPIGRFWCSSYIKP